MNTTGTRRGQGGRQQQQSAPRVPGSKLYQTIMTPINFITFLLSLWLVSNNYQRRRIAMHDDNSSSSPSSSSSKKPKSSFPPQWLHRMIYRPQPYTYIDSPSKNPPNENDERFYYHTKQRKIMKLEAADAFELRSSVLGALCVAGVAGVWGFVLLVRVMVGMVIGRGLWGEMRL